MDHSFFDHDIETVPPLPALRADAARVLIVGDLHIRDENVEQALALCRSLEALIRLHPVSLVHFAGDVFDEIGKVQALSQCAFTLIIERLRDAGAPRISITPGNHDMRSNNQMLRKNMTTVGAFRLAPFVTVAEEPTIITLPTERGACSCGHCTIGANDKPHVHVLLAPYMPDNRLLEGIRRMRGCHDVTCAELVLAHQTLRDVCMSGSCTEEWPLDYPLFVSGHEHQYQICQENAMYVGAPYHRGGSPITHRVRVGMADIYTGCETHCVHMVELLSVPMLHRLLLPGSVFTGSALSKDIAALTSMQESLKNQHRADQWIVTIACDSETWEKLKKHATMQALQRDARVKLRFRRTVQQNKNLNRGSSTQLVNSVLKLDDQSRMAHGGPTILLEDGDRKVQISAGSLFNHLRESFLSREISHTHKRKFTEALHETCVRSLGIKRSCA